MQDARFNDAMKACMNCGICTAICPAAEFFDYDPRQICDTVRFTPPHIFILHRPDTACR